MLDEQEGHFLDFKGREIMPKKLSQSFSALSNAEGGDLYVGISEEQDQLFKSWRGFNAIEDANPIIQMLDDVSGHPSDFAITWLEYGGTYVLKIEVRKSKEVVKATSGDVFLRRGAQNIKQTSLDQIRRIEYAKGQHSYEMMSLPDVPLRVVTDSDVMSGFIARTIPQASPEMWLKKQLLISEGDHPKVAAVLLFSDEPQAALPKRSGVKIYRYKSSLPDGARADLDGDPVTVEGCLHSQIERAVRATVDIVSNISVLGVGGLEKAVYPDVAIHEIVTNALIHRDYSIADDVHIRIFDNRIEVVSPGALPGHVTVQNILEERFSRNGSIVRLINKFPNPPNKDIGEGLNAAREAMRSVRLKDPVIEQVDHVVKVTLMHEKLASKEEIIVEYLVKNKIIQNKTAREITNTGSENEVKRIFQGMIRRNIIELVPGTSRYTAKYQLKAGQPIN